MIARFIAHVVGLHSLQLDHLILVKSVQGAQAVRTSITTLEMRKLSAHKVCLMLVS